MNLGSLKCYYTKSKWPSGGVWINFDEFGGSQMLLYKVQMAVGRGLDQFCFKPHMFCFAGAQPTPE